MGEKATQLRGELRELVKTHVPGDFLGAFTDDPAGLAGYWPSVGCCACPGRKISVEGALRCGSRPWCARKCGPTTSPGVLSTWESTGLGRSSCATAPKNSSASTCRRSRTAR